MSFGVYNHLMMIYGPPPRYRCGKEMVWSPKLSLITYKSDLTEPISLILGLPLLPGSYADKILFGNSHHRVRSLAWRCISNFVRLLNPFWLNIRLQQTGYRIGFLFFPQALLLACDLQKIGIFRINISTCKC